MSIPGSVTVATSGGLPPRRETLLRRIWKARLLYLLMIPSLAFVLVFSYVPAASAIYHAFTRWSGGKEVTWIGLGNFKTMLGDAYLNASWTNMIKLTVFHIVIMVIPLFIAVCVFRLRDPVWQYRYRVLLILPAILPFVVVALLWTNFLSNNGLVNQTLDAFGLGHFTRPWLGDFDTALYGLMFVGFPWTGGVTILFYLAGLMAIPSELVDAVTVDGVNSWQRFWHLELPLVMGQVKLFLVLTVIYNVQTYTLPLIMTRGGPGFATMVPGLHMFLTAVERSRYGYSSAIGALLFLLIFGLTYLNMKYVRSTVEVTGT
jgi:raffinose/stachyose/melibiose transport system permease protein